MKNAFKILAAAAALSAASLSFAATPASASASTPAAQTQPATPEDALAKQLNLTTEQRTKIKAIREKTDKEMSSIDESKVKPQLITDMIFSGKWDDAAVKNQLAAMSKVQERVQYLRARYWFDINAVLTAEQKTKLKGMMTHAN